MVHLAADLAPRSPDGTSARSKGTRGGASFAGWNFGMFQVQPGLETSTDRDAQIILAHLGHEPPDLEFRYYADSLARAD